MEGAKKYLRLILNIVIPIAGFYLICVLGPKILGFFLPFVIGWVISMIANPPVRFLENRLKIVRKHGSIMLVVTVLALIIFLLYYLIAKLIAETSGFISDIPAYFHMISQEVKEIINRLEQLLSFLPDPVQESLNTSLTGIGEYLNVAVQNLAPPTVSAAGHVVKSIPATLVYTVVTIFSSYLFIVDRDRILTAVRKVTPQGVLRYWDYLRADVKHLVGGYFLAQFKIMFVVAFVLAVGFLILGVKYALLIAVVVSLLDFLPVIGTGTILIPWAILRLFSGEYAFGLGLLGLYLLTLVLRQAIQPKIVGDTMGLDPLMTLLFLYLGFRISGIAGMIIAVPVGMLFLNLYRFGAFDSFLYSVKELVAEVNRFRKEDGKP